MVDAADGVVAHAGDRAGAVFRSSWLVAGVEGACCAGVALDDLVAGGVVGVAGGAGAGGVGLRAGPGRSR